MDNNFLLIQRALILGIGATVIFDLWGQILKFAFKITPSNICLVGRWVLYMPKGIVRHPNINKAEAKKGECAAGWAVHYVIGISLAALFLLITGSEWIKSPQLLPALLFGILTAAAPLFIMQPAFGFGFAASRSPNPMQARLRSVMNHAAFGLGIYLFALLLKLI